MAKAPGQSGRLAALLPIAQRETIIKGLSSQLREEGNLGAPTAHLLADIVDEQHDPDAIVSLSDYVWTRLWDDAESESCLDEVAQLLASRPVIAKQLLGRLSASQSTTGDTSITRHGVLLLLRRPDTLAIFSQADLNSLLALLLSDDAAAQQVDADTQTSVLLSLLSFKDLSVGPQLAESQSASTGRSVWRKILILLTDKGSKHRRYTGYLLWARWLDSSSAFGERSPYGDASYWSRIRQGLQSSLPATQKICLYLLRRSKTIFSLRQTASDNPSTRHTSNDAQLAVWDRYVAAFETIVIEQYPNQVQACLTLLPNDIFAEEDLDDVNSSKLAVESSWWFALFTSALSTSSLDSIRAIVGRWILEQSLHSVKNSPQHNSQYCLRFLTTGLLPWAFQGQLYSKSISRNGSSAKCQHGENLTRFIHDFIQGCSSDDARNFYRLAVLQWMQESWNKLNVHAAGYVLLGLASSIPQEYVATEAIASLVTAFFRTSHRSEVQQQLIEPSCSRLAGRSVGESSQEQRTPERLNQVESSSTPGILELLHSSDASNGQCFRGPRLRSYCQNMANAVKKTPASSLGSDDTSWQSMLSNLWEEIEIQDYPRSAVVLLPSLIFYHDFAAISTDLETEAFSPVQITIMEKLSALSRGRIYIWTSLAEAVHGAFIRHSSLRTSPAITSFIVEFLNNPPEAKPEFILDIALAEATHEAIGLQPLTLELNESRGHAHIFDMINILRCDTSPAATQLLHILMQPWLEQKPPVPMVSKWKRTTQIQAMVILIESLKSDQAAEVCDKFMDILAFESLPRFRFLLEWIVTTLRRQSVGEDNDTRSCRILAHIGQQELNPTNPKYLASLLKIAIHIATSSGATEAYSEALFEHLVAMSASPKIVIRHEAQWQFLVLYRHAERQGWAIVNNIYLKNLNRFIRSLEKAMATPLIRKLEAFDVDHDRNLNTVFEGGYLKLEPTEEPLFSSSDYEKVIATVSASQTSRATSRILAFKSSAAQRASSGLPMATTTVESSQIAPQTKTQSTNQTTDALSAFQTKAKSTQFLDIPAHLLDDAGLLSSKTASGNSNEPQMILVASLVDSAFNLGGLSRAAEIFGCNELHVDNVAVVKDKAFTALSVSSESHIKIVETKAQSPKMSAGSNTPAPLVDMLGSKKKEGWTVVGIEQTSTSFVLGEYAASMLDGEKGTGLVSPEVVLEQTRLPRKAIFVLGAEKTGLPGWLLPWMDDCAEIRQHGVTRSLNVQTAAAIVMWEWRRIYGSTK